ncbi:MAG: hypothetical protein JWR80_10198 [Bradyrhizobium sp.]|nr:hypothetical protein [Bradyrhizobium sp.]
MPDFAPKRGDPVAVVHRLTERVARKGNQGSRRRPARRHRRHRPNLDITILRIATLLEQKDEEAVTADSSTPKKCCQSTDVSFVTLAAATA